MTIAAVMYLTTIAALFGADQPANNDAYAQALTQSREYEKNKDYPKAIAVLTEQKEASSDPYLLNLRLGWLHYLNCQFDDAERYYQAVMKTNPKSVEAKLGCLLPMLAGKQYQEAEALARQIVKDDPRNYYANLRLVVALRLQQKFGEAMGIAQEMLVTYPADPHFTRELAILSAAQTVGNAAPSLSAESKSKIDEAVCKCRQLEKEQKHSEAIEALQEQFAAHPQDYTLNLYLGWLHYLTGNYHRSSNFYYTAIQAAPRSSEAGIGYLLPLLAEGRYSDAESFARQITQGDPGNYYANLRLATALRLQGKYDEAEKVIRPMLDAYPTDILFMTEMGLLDLARDQKDAANKSFSNVLALDPENATAKKQLGL
jgi:tetratricopeptide (TPR) repeat protein